MTHAMRWFIVIAVFAIGAPYLLGVRPRTRRQWFYIAVTLGFLAWILPFMASLRAQSTPKTAFTTNESTLNDVRDSHDESPNR